MKRLVAISTLCGQTKFVYATVSTDGRVRVSWDAIRALFGLSSNAPIRSVGGVFDIR